MFLIHVLTSQRRGFCSPILVSHPSSTGNRNTASKKVPLVGTWYLYWLVVCVPLWKIWKSVGIIIPNLWKNKKMFQTTNIHQPTRSIKHNETLASWLWGLEECVVLRIACFPHVFLISAPLSIPRKDLCCRTYVSSFFTSWTYGRYQTGYMMLYSTETRWTSKEP